MDECIEEEMSQDMEKGFCVLGTSFRLTYLSSKRINIVMCAESSLLSHFLHLHFFSVKYARDPSNFYASKLHSSLESGDTDTAGRIIFTSTTVWLFALLNYFSSVTKGYCVSC